MAVPFLRRSPFFRALVLTTFLFSFLTWLYVVLRVVVNGADVHWPFVDSVPSISISAVGAGSFALSFLSLLVYLWLWGRAPRAVPMFPGSEDREP